MSFTPVSGDTLYTGLYRVAKQNPRQPAIIGGESALSYGALISAIEQVTEQLLRAGFSANNRVGILIPNSVDFVCVFFAVARLGGVAVPLNPLLTAKELATIINASGVSIVATCSSSLKKILAIKKENRLLQVLVIVDTCTQAVATDFPEHKDTSTPDDIALHLYTSGSTGQPKRIERTHFNLSFEMEKFIREINLSCSDVVLGVAPFSHVNGLMRSMIASVWSGATLLPVAQFDRRSVGQLIDKHRVSVFIGVPFMFAMLADTRWPHDVDFSCLRLCVSSSAPLQPDISKRFYRRFGIYIRQLYGTSETGTISINLDFDITNSLASVGPPLQGIDVQIFSQDLKPLGSEETGDIGIKSPAAAVGYAGQAEETQRSFREGYFFPGDIGKKDKTGKLYLTGRRSFLINRGGYKVNPFEIEDVLNKHPKVKEAVVVGVKTQLGEENIKAYVVLATECEVRNIIEFCSRQLATYKLPSSIEFRDELPKTPVGKVLRNSL